MATKRTLTHGEVDAKLQEAIRSALDKGYPLEGIRILSGGLEWRWSPVLRKWDLYDETLAKRADLGGDE